MVNARPDLLVIGGGMAGMTAAAWVVRQGGSAVVIERAPGLGGSARYAGYLHTATSAESLRAADPAATPELQERLVAGFPEGMEWVRSLDVACGPEVDVLRLTRGRLIDTNGYINACAALVGADSILLDARTDRLIRNGDAVTGAEVTTADGRSLIVEAGSVVLATGGFQGDPQLVAEHIDPQGASMPLRSNPTSTGDGLRLGAAVGGAIGPEGAMFYGHLVPLGIPLGDPSGFATLSQYYSDHALLFNVRGDRFVDETLGDHVNAVFTVEQSEARALLVIDSRVREQWMMRPLVEGMQPEDRFTVAMKRGARAAVAEDVEEFAFLPEEWGYPGERIRDAITSLNEALIAGRPTQPSRAFDTEPLVDPPYYAMDVVPAITFSYPGVRIDGSTRVLDGDGRPIPGLLAAGADAGGTFAGEYAGGLANALVFGIQAAKTALAGSA